MSLYKCLEHKAKSTTLDLGIKKDQVGSITHGLSIVLASTQVLALKVQGLHWNVVGPHFYEVHKLTESLYSDLYAAADELAERIRALGHPAPASYEQFMKISRVKETIDPISAEESFRMLLGDYEELSRFMRETIELAESARDYATADLLTKQLGDVEKAAWMLRVTVS